MGKLMGRLTKRKQELRKPITMHRDGAEEAESRRGTMLAVEHCGKLHVMCQQMLGGLWNMTVFPP